MQTQIDKRVNPSPDGSGRSDFIPPPLPDKDTNMNTSEYVLTFKRGPNIHVRVEIRSSDPLKEPLTQADFKKTIGHLELDMEDYPAKEEYSTKKSQEQGTDYHEHNSEE